MSEAVSALIPDALTSILRAVQARLQLVFPLALFGHEIMPARLGQKEWQRLMRRTPFVGVGWSDLAANRETGRLFQGLSGWAVFLAARNQASIGARYTGDAQGIGLFPMVSAAVAMIHGWTLAGAGTAMVTRVANVYAEGWEDESAMASVEFALPLVLPLAGAVSVPGDLGSFQRFGVTWNMAGVDELGPDLITETGA